MPACDLPLLIELLLCLHLDVRLIQRFACVSRRARDIVMNSEHLWLELLYLNYHLSAHEYRLHKRSSGGAAVIASAMQQLVLSDSSTCAERARRLYRSLHRCLYLDEPLELAASDLMTDEKILQVYNDPRRRGLPVGECCKAILNHFSTTRSSWTYHIKTQFGYGYVWINRNGGADEEEMQLVFMTTVVDLLLDDQLFDRPSFYAQTVFTCKHLSRTFGFFNLLVENVGILYPSMHIALMRWIRPERLHPSVFWPPIERHSAFGDCKNDLLAWQMDYDAFKGKLSIFFRRHIGKHAALSACSDKIELRATEDTHRMEFVKTDDVYSIHLFTSQPYRQLTLGQVAFAFGLAIVHVGAYFHRPPGVALFQLFDCSTMQAVGPILELCGGCYTIQIVERVCYENVTEKVRVALKDTTGPDKLLYYSLDVLSGTWHCLFQMAFDHVVHQHACVTADGFVTWNRDWKQSRPPQLWNEWRHLHEPGSLADSCAHRAIRQAAARVAFRQLRFKVLQL